jgi:hypothetical protein
MELGVVLAAAAVDLLLPPPPPLNQFAILNACEWQTKL